MIEVRKKHPDNNIVLTDEKLFEEATSKDKSSIAIFISSHFATLLSVEQRSEMIAKYNSRLKTEQVNENGRTKRLFTQFIDRLIGCSIKCLTAKAKVDEQALSLYLSYPNDEDELDIEEFAMNKFVFENIDLENLTKLVYNRYLQKTSTSSKNPAAENNKTKKNSGGTKIIMEKTDPTNSNKVDENLLTAVKSSIDGLIKEGKSIHTETADLIMTEIGRRVSCRVSNPPKLYSPSQNNNNNSESTSKPKNSFRKRKMGVKKMSPIDDEGENDSDDSSEDDTINEKIKKNSMEPIEKIFQKIANMNQNIEAVVREQNELLDTSLYTKASDCYIKDKNDQRVYVGDGLYSYQPIEAGAIIVYYNGIYKFDSIYHFEVWNDASRGDYAISVGNSIIYDCYDQMQQGKCFASKANSAENLNRRNQPLQRNAKIVTKVVNNLKLFAIVAEQNIAKDKEILVNYTMYDHLKFFENSADYKDSAAVNTNNNNKIDMVDNRENELVDLMNDMERNTGKKNFIDFMVEQSHAESVDDALQLFQQMTISCQYSDFIDSFATHYPNIMGKCNNNANEMMSIILLNIGCNCLNSEEFLSELLIYFEVENVEPNIQELLVNKIILLHSNFIIELNDLELSSLFATVKIYKTMLGKDYDIHKKTVIQDKCQHVLEKREIMHNYFKSLFVAAKKKPLFDSVRKYIADLKNPPSLNLIDLRGDTDDDIETIEIEKNGNNKNGKKRVRFNFDDDNYHLLKDPDGYVSVFGDVPPTATQMLNQRKEHPDDELIEQFVSAIEIYTIADQRQNLFSFLNLEDMFAGTSRMMMERDSLFRLSPKLWLDNFAIDRTIAMFRQHLQLCNIKYPDDNRFNKYLLFYVDKMCGIHKYKDGRFQAYRYKTSWYKDFIDLFDREFIIYPCHYVNSHWFLIVVFMTDRRIVSYDSCDFNHEDYMIAIEKSLKDEAINRNRLDLIDVKTGKFNIPFVKEKGVMPQQQNTYDCGVFMLMLINFIIDGIPISSLSQNDMRSYRVNLACDIIRQKMNYYK